MAELDRRFVAEPQQADDPGERHLLGGAGERVLVGELVHVDPVRLGVQLVRTAHVPLEQKASAMSDKWI